MLLTSIKERLLREGLLFRKIRRFLQESQRYSLTELQAYQDERLRRIIRHAYEHVPYYRDVFQQHKLEPRDIQGQEDLWKLPILTKQDVKQNLQRLRARNIPRFLMSMGHTSGTTGEPAHFYRDLYSVNFEQATVWRQWEWAGFRRGDSLAVCRGSIIVPEEQTAPPFWVYEGWRRTLYLSAFHLSDASLPHYMDVLQDTKPAVLQAYPSTAHTIARAFQKAGRQLPLQAVFTSSEPLYTYQRACIEAVFQCRIWDFYGMAERVISASECLAHEGLHLNEEYGITEFLQNGELHGDEGVMVGTSLQNYAMPLIRYQTNDYGKRLQEPCTCGMAHRRIHPIETKQEDMILTADGRWISPSIITHAFKPLQHVARSQVIQHTVRDYEILLVPEPGYTAAETDILEAGLRERFGQDAHIRIRQVTDIPRTKNGKYRWVISHVKEVPHRE